MKLIPAIRVRVDSHVRSFLIFFAVMALLMIVLATGILTSDGDISGGISATTVSSAIFAFVLGICSVREDMRILMQFGISRRTSYLTRLISAVILAIFSSLLSELLLALSAAIAAKGMWVADIYQILYEQEGAAMGLAGHAASFVMNCALVLALYEFGETFSLAFFRTNKLGTVALGIFIGVFPGLILPALFNLPGVSAVLISACTALFGWLGLSVWNLVLFLLLWTLVSLAINYLLMRRAPIKPAKA